MAVERKPLVAAVIAAAGVSRRMGWDKQLMPLGGMPVILHTLRAFECCPAVDRVVVAAREEAIPDLLRLVRDCGLKKVRSVVRGADSRQASVLAGVMAAGEADFYCVHDGARPLVTPEEIQRVTEDAFRFGAAALGVPVRDTVKRVRDGMICATVDRQGLYLIQTPQVFAAQAYLKACALAGQQGRDYTDDCQLMEAAGFAVHLTEGSPENLKLTAPQDVRLAQALLAARWEEEEA